MKTTIILLVALFLSSLTVNAESYQRWIYWVNQPNHAATVADMVEITTRLNNGEIIPWEVNTLQCGVTFKIPQPELYLSYIVKCVRSGEPDIETVEDVIAAIADGDVVRWGNDLNCKVKNYFFSSLHKEVRFMPDYDGSEKGVWVLLVRKKPKIKTDCGNPLEPYDKQPRVVASVVSVPVPTNTINNDTVIVRHIWEETKPFQELNTRSAFEETKKIDLGFEEIQKEKVGFFKTTVGKILVGGLILTATGAVVKYAFFNKPKTVYIDEGGPAGAPGYPANTNGPGGSPGYGKINTPNNIGIVIPFGFHN